MIALAHKSTRQGADEAGWENGTGRANRRQKIEQRMLRKGRRKNNISVGQEYVPEYVGITQVVGVSKQKE